MQATIGDKQVTLGWEAPADNGGAAITGYQFRYKKSAEGDDTFTAWASSDTDTSHTVTGLTNDTEYTFEVRAVNSEGEGIAASVKATPTA